MSCQDHALNAVTVAKTMGGIQNYITPPAEKLGKVYAEKILVYARGLQTDETIPSLVENFIESLDISQLKQGDTFPVVDETFELGPEEKFTYYVGVGKTTNDFGIPTQQLTVLLLDPVRTPVASVPVDVVLEADGTIDKSNLKEILTEAFFEAKKTIETYVQLHR